MCRRIPDRFCFKRISKNTARWAAPWSPIARWGASGSLTSVPWCRPCRRSDPSPPARGHPARFPAGSMDPGSVQHARHSARPSACPRALSASGPVGHLHCDMQVMHLRSCATSTRPGRHVLRAKLTRGAEGPKASGRPVGSEPRGAQAGHGGHAPSTHVLRRAEAVRSPSRPWTRLRSRRETDQITCLRWTDNVHPRPTPRTRAGRGPESSPSPRGPSSLHGPYTPPAPHQQPGAHSFRGSWRPRLPRGAPWRYEVGIPSPPCEQ